MLARRTTRVSTSPTMKVGVEADRLRRQGKDVVELGAGEPDFATPDHVKAAAIAAIDANFTKYTANAGITDLRAAIVAFYRRLYGIELTEAEVIVSAGGKQALYNPALAIIDAGDEVITHAPGWPTLREQIKLADATPVIVRAHADAGFALTAQPFIDAMSPRTRAVIVNSPCNPTGALMSEAEMALLADACAARGIWVLLDLCYEQLIYEPTPHNLPRVLFERMRDRTVIAGSASKTYAMTGWRCGWTVAAPSVIAACNAIQSHATSNVCSITQRATVAALGGPQACVGEMLGEYRARRDMIWALLTADPRIRCVKPSGAFYLFIDIGDLLSPDGIRTSTEFAERLLEEQYVALTGGEAFDAPGFLRISYATSVEQLQEGARRFHAFVASLDAAGSASAAASR
ncbi:MAG: pyridoxal phosphate-dependent aminotransferase [Acidobacteria bacterium]|nr:pyridoxal phosphate-dependent aminotransferase [Acidobacteriota bacterium]